MKQPLVILTGPTAVGKTETSLRIAEKIRAEILSADSMQVYKGLDIGSAKIRPEEQNGIRHHLIDVLDPWEDFNVVRFQQMAKKAMKEIWRRGHIPLVTGGTGFYIQAILYDIDFTETEAGASFRKKWERMADEKGALWLHDRLREVDRESAEAIHPHNIKRVVRALEFFEQTGEKISRHNETERQKASPYAFSYFVLTRPREELYRRIDLRVDQMMEQGLLEEVRKLKEQGCRRGFTSMQGLGYKELLAYLDGAFSLEEAVYRIKRDTRHFAKRQLTWFSREREVTRVDMDAFSDIDSLDAFLLEEMKRKGCIE
ncbi:MAG: tRNA (adenosine(37)-N6)-dimethylallyltransferase MiaA [Lachnospiraceae bacterium]|nr:tRNA (adenosine(37)-N6)-dimethylallyltransferase MiaA [Lachnospiraceae bacterium]